MDRPLFQTQREKLLKLYQAAKQPFVASTQPYHSVRSIKFDIVDVDITNGLAWAVARRGQRLTFFGYGVGDNMTLHGTNLVATDAETNLAAGKSTNGAADMVIEGIGMSCRAMYTDYEIDTSGLLDNIVTDPDVIAALDGEVALWDPAAVVVPPQVQSPANLEQGLFQGLLPLMSVEFEWDRKRTVKLGVCDLLPQGGAASYLRANGVPSSDNRYEIPEGYVWRRDGEPDGEFLAHVIVERPFVVPISLRSSIDAPGTYHTPANLYLDVTMRLYGLECQLPSAN